jgi:DNA replication protein DnaC
LEKSWPALDLKRLPARVVQQLRSLLEGSFLDRQENVLIFGQPGSGKTHLLCALGQELVRAGRKVLFRKCGLLVQELLAAKRDLKLPRLLKQMAGYEALIVDDLGYVQQSREEMEVLFLLLAERYERGSVLLSSNLPFSGWEAIFKDAMTTAAAIDRLVHHSVIVELNIPSYRAEAAKKARQSRAGAGTGEAPAGEGAASAEDKDRAAG